MSAHLLLVMIITVVAATCTHERPATEYTGAHEVRVTPEDTTPYRFDGIDPPDTLPKPIEEYPGRTIDQVFPITVENEFSRGSGERESYQLAEAGYDISAYGFTPVSISRNGRLLLRFSTRDPRTAYHSILVGSAKLLGKDTSQIYIVSMGPGAVCCTNYWIVDISEHRPRLIFRSEEFGYFREPMEIVDFDGDGIYELMQLDSCFRYFADGCGTCTPEPRAYFKYDRTTRKYRPASRIVEDFVNAASSKTETMVKERLANLKDPIDRAERDEIDAIVFSHFVDLLHQGRTNYGWSFFNKYHSKPSREMLKEIRYRLANCAYYKSLAYR